MKDEIIQALNEIQSTIEDLDVNPKNDFGYYLVDEIHETNWRLQQLTEAVIKQNEVLEKLSDRLYYSLNKGVEVKI
jgi:hypothetical protein